MTAGTQNGEHGRWLAALGEQFDGVTRACVAFSGGVDSSLLLWAAARRLGTQNVVAFTATSATYLPDELETARRIAGELGVTHVVAETDEFDDPSFVDNPRERCYHCKQHLVRIMAEVAEEHGCDVLLDGANHDDLGDHRPGMRAAGEAGVRHPLLAAGLGKDAVRALAREAGLATWDAPAQACLASRVPYGEPITPDKLAAVAEAERVLRELGFNQCRVRHHGQVARIEVEAAEIERAAGVAREDIAHRVRAAGFTYVALDLHGFRSGSMNEGDSVAGLRPPAVDTTCREER